MSKEDIQRKYLELQLLSHQVNQMQQQLQALDNQLSMLEKTRENIAGIKEISQNSKAFIPLGQGVFVEGSVSDNENLLVNVGADTIVKKSTAESKEIVEKQIAEVNSMIRQMEDYLQKASFQAQLLEGELQELASKEKE